MTELLQKIRFKAGRQDTTYFAQEESLGCNFCTDVGADSFPSTYVAICLPIRTQRFDDATFCQRSLNCFEETRRNKANSALRLVSFENFGGRTMTTVPRYFSTQTATAHMSGGTVPRSPAAISINPRSPHLLVTFGQATFDAEGQEALNAFFSRRLHNPSASSGVTIGRGYDMRQRTNSQIEEDLGKAGVSPKDAQWIAQAAGLYGGEARAFVTQHRESAPLLTLEQQKKLFEEITTPEMISDIKRICAKPDTIKMYGHVSWDTLPKKMQELLFDLRYRGDYTPTIRKSLQPLLAAADYTRVQKLIEDRRFWQQHKVPAGRIEARIQLLQAR